MTLTPCAPRTSIYGGNLKIWPPAPERLASGIQKLPNGCWQWLRSCRGKYPTIHVQGKDLCAHRYSYELHKGPVPSGLTLDHLCRNTRCVNPTHLEPVTNRENVLRGIGPSAINAKKTKCPQGHVYSAANTRVSSSGKRHCRTCHRFRMRRNYRAALAQEQTR